jgi:uncharacterized membrane protein
MTYAYIDKLEKVGCACSEHRYRKFVKNFPLVAVVYIVLFLFLSPAMIFDAFGSVGKFVMDALVFLFGITAIVFFVLAFLYTRYLMTEKCKCSEDMRRDVLYVWSLLEIVLIVALVVLMLLTTTIMGNMGANVSSALGKTSEIGHGALHKPLHHASKISKSLRRFK